VIVSTNPIKNPFKISTITIDDFDISDYFLNLTLEEGIFNTFIYGTLVLDRRNLVPPKTWNNPEFGFINRTFKINWTHNMKDENYEFNKEIELKIYGIHENTMDNIVLLLIQEGAYNFINKQFCDGWKDLNINEIVNDIIFTKTGIKNLSITKTSNKFTYVNPIIWSPSQALKYLLPMMKSESGDCAYVLFSSTKESGKMYCLPVNTLFNNKVSEELVLLAKQPEKTTDIELTLNMILGYNFNSDYSNILEQMNDDIYGSNIEEYDPKTKVLKPININNIIQKNVKMLGSESSILDNFDTTESQYAFYFSGMNGETIEKSETIYEYLIKNNILISVYGFSTRNVGDIVNLNLYSGKNMINDPRNEYSGNIMISNISHMFSISGYYQKLSCVRSGYNKYENRDIL